MKIGRYAYIEQVYDSDVAPTRGTLQLVGPERQQRELVIEAGDADKALLALASAACICERLLGGSRRFAIVGPEDRVVSTRLSDPCVITLNPKEG